MGTIRGASAVHLPRGCAGWVFPRVRAVGIGAPARHGTIYGYEWFRGNAWQGKEGKMKKLSVLLLLVGCGSVSPRPEIEGISWGYQGYDDLPVPQDFTFDDSDRSWAYRRYENSALNLRSGVFRYVGDRDVGQLVNWYNQQMPEHDWEQASLDKDQAGWKARLVFTKEKGSEAAVVDLVREAGPEKAEPFTTITVTVGVASAIQ